MAQFHWIEFLVLQALVFVARAAPPQLSVTNIKGTVLTNAPSNIDWSNSTGMICNKGTCQSHPVALTMAGFDDPDEPEISDINYYRFSTHNIALSRADAWYAAWSISRQNDSDWTELGEWKLFAKDFAKTYNFECDLTFGSCVHYPSLGDLQNMWPGAANRPLVRRIFFTLHRYALAHDYVRAIDESFDRAHTYLLGLIPQIISTFTLQVDPAKKLKCEQLHTLINQIVNIGTQLAVQVLSGLLGPEMGVLDVATRIAIADVASLKTKMAKAVEDGVSKSMRSTMTKKIADLEVIIQGAKAREGKLNWWTLSFPLDKRAKETKTPRNVGWANIFVWNAGFLGITTFNEFKKAHDAKNQFISPGIAHGTICSNFEGDFTDNNAGNRDSLGFRISSIFESSRQQRQRMFKAIYRGLIIEPGQPSATAMWLQTRDWIGPRSVLEDMKDISAMEEAVKTSVVKGLISDTLTSDFNYIKCGYFDKATSHCKKAETAKKGKDVSVFCPYPDTDPRFMCDARRWYFSDNHQHDIPMVAAKKFEGFASNRFNFTQQNFLQESFQNYKLYGHSRPKELESWGYGNSSSQGIGFNLPVCVTDKPRFFESKGYPSICGDWHSSETTSFIEAMNAGPNSTIYKYRKSGKPMYLYTEIIPQTLNNFAPLTRYLGFCDNGIRFPYVGEKPGPAENWLKIQQSQDKDCKLIQDATKGMNNEEEANRWFCTNQGGHTIFTREKDYTDSPHAKYLVSHSRRCTNWLKKKGNTPKDKVRTGT